MSEKRSKVSTDGGQGLSANPFAGLGSSGLPNGPVAKQPEKKPLAKAKSRGRVDVRREKAGRGGKTVTLAYGFVGISTEEKVSLAKTMQKRCGAGGSVKDGAIEIQGDQRECVRAVLEEAGFQVVLSGG